MDSTMISRGWTEEESGTEACNLSRVQDEGLQHKSKAWDDRMVDPALHTTNTNIVKINAPQSMHLAEIPMTLSQQSDSMSPPQTAKDRLTGMVGLQSVKDQFSRIEAKVIVETNRLVFLRNERLGALFLGNPGTGKSTVARLYAQHLVDLYALPGSYCVEISGSQLAYHGVTECKTLIADIMAHGGGCFLLDEADQLASGYCSGRSPVLEFLLPEIERLSGKVVFIFAGCTKKMEKFLAHNPGIRTRLPHQFKFEDFSNKELMSIFQHKINAKYGRDLLHFEGGIGGPYARILIDRLGRGRGREGFRNAKQVEDVIDQLMFRQAERITKARIQPWTTEYQTLTKLDLIGPEPVNALVKNAAWKELQALAGMESVKKSVQALLDTIQANYHRDLHGQFPLQYSLNKIFLGGPGTGKKTAAKLYGKILAELGLLTDGEVMVRKPSDFMDNYKGGSEVKTRAIFKAAKGKVLVIDKAYMLADEPDGGYGMTDTFRQAMIDTIVAEAQPRNMEDRCVLLLGCSDRLKPMLEKCNPGLARCFPIASSFIFDDFTEDELSTILHKNIATAGFVSTPDATKVAIESLSRARGRPNFGNAGEVDILLDKAKLRYQTRISHTGSKIIDILRPEDFAEDDDPNARATQNIRHLFKDIIGCDELVQQFQDFRTQAENLTAMGMDARDNIPMCFTFTGSPGTGKTTTARKVGQIYYNMGVLASPEVVECSASDLVGQYVGHTGPKTRHMFDKALGKVLFIDEAYRLANDHYGFANQAMDEIVTALTSTTFQKKLVVILAGYTSEINRLWDMKPRSQESLSQ